MSFISWVCLAYSRYKDEITLYESMGAGSLVTKATALQAVERGFESHSVHQKERKADRLLCHIFMWLGIRFVREHSNGVGLAVYGRVAQSVERRTLNPSAVGSNPTLSTNFLVWGHSSVGRAPVLQAGGRRFEPVCLHHTKGKVHISSESAALFGAFMEV